MLSLCGPGRLTEDKVRSVPHRRPGADGALRFGEGESFRGRFLEEDVFREGSGEERGMSFVCRIPPGRKVRLRRFSVPGGRRGGPGTASGRKSGAGLPLCRTDISGFPVVPHEKDTSD